MASVSSLRYIPTLFGDAEKKLHWSLSPTEQRRHRIAMRAYFLSQRPDRRNKTPVQNWLDAERVEDNQW